MARPKKNPEGTEEISEVEVTEEVSVSAAIVNPKPKPTSRIDSIMKSDLVKALNKKYGGAYLQKASEKRIQAPKRIPTGIFELDFALGGGWASGMFNSVYGQKSVSKTTTILRAIGIAQKLCGNCFTGSYDDQTCECGDFRECVAAYLDVEGTLDLGWAAMLGVDTARLIVVVPDFAEQTLDIGEQLIRSGDIDILVIDSIAFLTPSAEIEKSVENDNPGVHARKIGQGIRKFVAALNHLENTKGWRPTIFTTNQIRMKIGVMFGSPETVSGGQAPGFANSIEVKLLSGKTEVDDKLNKAISTGFKFRVEKNKSGSPKGEGEFTMMQSEVENKKPGDIMDENRMVSVAQAYGLLTGSGPSWVLFDENYYKGNKSGLEQKLMYDPVFKEKVRRDLLKAIL